MKQKPPVSHSTPEQKPPVSTPEGAGGTTNEPVSAQPNEPVPPNNKIKGAQGAAPSAPGGPRGSIGLPVDEKTFEAMKKEAAKPKSKEQGAQQDGQKDGGN